MACCVFSGCSGGGVGGDEASARATTAESSSGGCSCWCVLLFLAAGGLVLTFYETRIAEDARRDVVAEIDGIRGRIETLMSGSVGMSIGQLGSNPRFAPSALGGLIEARDRMVAARTRLRELADAGEEVAEQGAQVRGLAGEQRGEAARRVGAAVVHKPLARDGEDVRADGSAALRRERSLSLIKRSVNESSSLT